MEKLYSKRSKPFNEKGMILPLVLIVMIICFSIGGAIAAKISFDLRESNNYRTYQEALLFGKNAVEECHSQLINNFSSYTGTGGKRTDDNGSICEISVKTQKGAHVAGTKTITVKVYYHDFLRHYEGTAVPIGDKNHPDDIEFSVKLKR